MTQTGAIAWSWRNMAYGAALAVPATAVALWSPERGLPLAIGVLPAAALGLRSSRRQRAMVVIVGTLAGFAMLLGSIVAPWPLLAVAAMFGLCVGTAVLVADPARRLAPLAMMLGLPLFGAGLSEAAWTTGLAAACLILGGSVYAWLVSLAWPESPGTPRPPRTPPPRATMLVYGVQIGVAGAAAAALGFALGVDHPGWACTAALLVSRPDRKQLDARGRGRALSVTGGALVACTVALASPTNAAIAVLLLAAIATGTGTSGSRWYVFPFFSTVIVLSMLTLDDAASAPHWFLERVLLTLAGVALALVSAWAVGSVTHSARAVRATHR